MELDHCEASAYHLRVQGSFNFLSFKVFVFQATIQAAQGDLLLLIVTVIGVLTSVVSAFYYMRVVIVMWAHDGEGRAVIQPALGACLAMTALGTLFLGLFPTSLFQLAQQALITLAG